MGHLVALRLGVVQLDYHVHLENVDDFHGNDEGEIWALTGAGGTASTIAICTRSAYDRLSGEPNHWSTMASWTTKDDVTKLTDKAKSAAKAKSKQAAKQKTPAGSGRTRRSTFTPKMKDYKKSMVTDSSDEDDDEEEVKIVTVHDKNVDPDESREKRTGVIVPNMLPIPAFMVVALMKKAYT
jgi:hypothetical protein